MTRSADALHAPVKRPLKPSASIWRSVPFVALCVIYLVANLSVGAMPVLFGGFVDQRHVSLELAGSFATAETTGLAIGSGLAIALITRARCSERTLLTASLLVCASMQVLTALCHIALVLIMVRAGSGICTALVQATAIAWISQHPRPARPLAVFVSMAFLSGAIGIGLFSYTMAATGFDGTFAIFAALLLAAMIVIPLAPRSRQFDQHVIEAAESPSLAPELKTSHRLLLLAIAANFTMNSGLWVYMERIGQWDGIQPASVASILSASMFAAMASILALGIAGPRAKPRPVIVLGHFVLLVATVLFLKSATSIQFGVAAVAFNVGVALLPPILLTTLAVSDPTGRTGLQALTAINVGYAVGPQVFSWIVAFAGMQVALGLSVVAFAVSLPICTRGLGHNQSRSGSIEYT